MNHQIYPCLWYDGKAKAAADLYCSVFKNSKITTNTPMVVMFELNGHTMMGLNGGSQFKFTPGISIFATFESIEETDAAWKKLIEGGEVLIPIDKQDWSERYRWLKDKFGMTWQISVVNNTGDKQKLTPSFLFTDKKFGKAEEAIKFYTSVFKHSSIGSLQHYPPGDANAGKVLYSEFNLNGCDLIAMDGPGKHHFDFNEAVSLVVNCKDQNEIDHYWHTLTSEGQESMCGWLKDKYGVSWQIIPEVLGKLMSDPQKGQKVMQELLKMRKLNLQTLEKAAQ